MAKVQKRFINVAALVAVFFLGVIVLTLPGCVKVMLSLLENGDITWVIDDIALRSFLGVLLNEKALETLLPNLIIKEN